MKLLVVNGTKSTDGNISVTLMADSTLMRSGMPFFIPDFAPHFAVTPMLALRVGRLGKCITRRFAHRYIDAVTAAIVVTPLDHELNPLQGCDMMHAFDGATMMGTWQEFNPAEFTYSMQWTYNGEQHSMSAADVTTPYEQVIEYISKFGTIKMGDVICISSPAIKPQVVKIEDRLEVSIAGNVVLKSKIK